MMDHIDVTSVQQLKVCGCMRGFEVLYMMDPVGAASTVWLHEGPSGPVHDPHPIDEYGLQQLKEIGCMGGP